MMLEIESFLRGTLKFKEIISHLILAFQINILQLFRMF